MYGTEEIVGKALKGVRDEVVLSTKALPWKGDGLVDGAGLRQSVESSLRLLRTEWVDVLHLHGVVLGAYDHCVDMLLPEMLRLRDEGKIRFLGISEAFAYDTAHEMLARAVGDPSWDVIMVGFNLLNPSAATTSCRAPWNGTSGCW